MGTCGPKLLACASVRVRATAQGQRAAHGGDLPLRQLFARYPLAARLLFAYCDQAVWFILVAMSESMKRTFAWSRCPSDSAPRLPQFINGSTQPGPAEQPLEFPAGFVWSSLN